MNIVASLKASQERITPAQDDKYAVIVLETPKVSLTDDGRLTELSAKILLIELERYGYRLTRKD